MGNGESSLLHRVSPLRKESETVDLHLKQIPQNTDDRSFRKLAGARHIVDTSFQHDKLTGTLTGEGHMRVRLAQGETIERVKENLEKSGISVDIKSVNAGRRPVLSQKELIEMRVIAQEVRKMFPNQSSKMKKELEMKGSQQPLA